jgi:polyisoprenoid-binding protein YceI
VRGHFSIRTGVVDVNEPIGESGIRVEAEAASFRTLNPMRDSAVRSAQFLDVERFPLITFVSTGLDGTALAGELTAHGVTLPVTFEIEPDPASVAPDSFTLNAVARIDRTEFGVTAMPGMAGRYLNVVVRVRCVKR